MGTITVTDFTGALEGVADTDYRLVAGGARVSSPYNHAMVDQHVIACLRCEEAAWSGADSVIDASGNGYHGTPYNGATTVSGAVGRYGDVVGTRYVLTRPIPWPNNACTFEAWVRPLSSTPNERVLFSGQAVNFAIIKLSAGTYLFSCHQAGMPLVVPITEDVWQHWTFMQSGRADAGGIMTLHVNGALVASGPTWIYSTATLALGIGAFYTGALGSVSDLYADEVRLSSVLRQSQSANFTAPTMLSAASLRTSASAVDSARYGGGPGALWSTLQFAMAAPTGDETAAVWFAASDYPTVPGPTDPAWTLLGSGYTTGQLLNVSGFVGQYGHTMFGAGASTGIGQYAVELDGLEYTFAPAASGMPWLRKVKSSGRYA